MKCLVCFAVAQEKRNFRVPSDVQVLVTGMGAVAASSCLTSALETARPELIIAAGFAGGLNPELTTGQIILDDADCPAHDLDFSQVQSLFRGSIYSESKVLITPEDKAQVREETRADAVDMESASIRLLAKQHGITMVSLRVISDAFDESLPINFNQFMTENGGMRFGSLMLHIARHPGIIPELLQFQRKAQFAGKKACLNLSCHSQDR